MIVATRWTQMRIGEGRPLPVDTGRIAALCNRNGHFEMAGLSPGNWQFRVHSPHGVSLGVDTVTVPEGVDRYSVALSAPQVESYLYVVDPEGRPVEGLVVHFGGLSSEGVSVRSSSSDQWGRVLVTSSAQNTELDVEIFDSRPSMATVRPDRAYLPETFRFKVPVDSGIVVQLSRGVLLEFSIETGNGDRTRREVVRFRDVLMGEDLLGYSWPNGKGRIVLRANRRYDVIYSWLGFPKGDVHAQATLRVQEGLLGLASGPRGTVRRTETLGEVVTGTLALEPRVFALPK